MYVHIYIYIKEIIKNNRYVRRYVSCLHRSSYLSLKQVKVNLFLCRDFETILTLLLSKIFGSALAISFSQMHKSHFRNPQTYSCDFIAISQLIK